MATMRERIERAHQAIGSAAESVRADAGASPVLVAVVEEFARKADKALAADDETVAVIELEQAGDSAKAAAEADTGLSESARQAVLDAHLSICIAKGKLTS